jgi:hypothetical protein
LSVHWYDDGSAQLCAATAAADARMARPVERGLVVSFIVAGG